MDQKGKNKAKRPLMSDYMKTQVWLLGNKAEFVGPLIKRRNKSLWWTSLRG